MKKNSLLLFLTAILTASQLFLLTGCGAASGSQSSTAGSTSEQAADNDTENNTENNTEAGIVIIDSSESGSADSTGNETADEDSEVYQQAKEDYENLQNFKDEYLLENFEDLQEDSYDGNTSRFYADPDTQANLPEGFNTLALSLQDGEMGMTGKTDYGYFIILRTAFDEDDLTNIKNDMINEQFNKQLNELAAEADIQEAEVLSKLDFTAWMDNLITLQTTITDEYKTLSADSTDAVEIEKQLLEKLPEEAKEDCVAYLTDGLMDKNTVVMTVNGKDIKAGVFFYMLTYYKNTDYGTGSISESYLTIALNQAKADLVNDVLAQGLAEENNISLSQEEEDSNQEVLENTLDSSLIYQGCNRDALEELLGYTSEGNAYAAWAYGEDGQYDIPLDDVYVYAEEKGYYTCRYIWYYEDNTGSAAN